MKAFGLALTAFLLLLPALITLFVRARPNDAFDPELDRRMTRSLWTWTAIALAVTAALAGLEAAGYLGWYYELPFIMTFHKPPAEVMFVASVPLWMLTARLLNHRRSDFTPPRPAASRSATLTSRRPLSPVPARLWLLPWLFWIAANVVDQIYGRDLASRQRTAVVILLVVQVPLLVLAPRLPRLVMREPEPLPDDGDAAVEAAYRSLRNQRVWGFFALTIAMTIMWCGIIVAIVLLPDRDSTLGWIGAIAGSAIGIGGAVFGVWMGVSRARVNARVQELTQE